MIQLVRIAVCDDEPAFAERVKILIEAECRGLGVSAEVSLYTDSGMLAYDILTCFFSILRCRGFPAWSWRISSKLHCRRHSFPL